MFTYTEKLGLCHYTQEVGDTKMIMISNTPPGAVSHKSRSGSVDTKETSQSLRKSRSGSLEMPQRRARRMSCPTLESAPFVQKKETTGKGEVVIKGKEMIGGKEASSGKEARNNREARNSKNKL